MTAALGYGALVLALTLAPMPWAIQGAQHPLGILHPGSWLDPTSWTTGSPREFVLNILLFLPVGLLAARLGRRWGVVVPLLMALGIEVVQIPMLDRISDPRDLVANAAGAMVGLAVARASRPGGPPSPSARER